MSLRTRSKHFTGAMRSKKTPRSNSYLYATCTVRVFVKSNKILIVENRHIEVHDEPEICRRVRSIGKLPKKKEVNLAMICLLCNY